MGDVAPTSEEPPQIPKLVAEVLEAIGPDRWSEVTFLPTDTERKQIEERMQIARELSKTFRLLATREDSPVALPERLRSEEDVQADTLRAMADPVLASLRVRNYKTEFARAVRPLGYRYDPGESQRQIHVAKKASPSGNTILIISDIGGHWTALVAQFSNGGPRVGLEN